MSDEAREYIRAAQAAEISGDKPRAVELLKKAAVLFRDRGNHARALQMLRHARRLDVGMIDVEDEIKRLEWIPDDPLGRATIIGGDEEDEGGDEADRALASLDEVAGPPKKTLVERGPTLADPTLQAWCSFCCLPRTEVGDLVAGPAGAFICQKCLGESAKLLGVGLAPKGGGPALSLVPPPAGALEFLGQPEALHVLDAALRAQVRVILLLGPEGTGKTTYLRQLERQGQGRYVGSLEALAEIAESERLLLDLDVAALADDSVRARLSSNPLVIAVRAEPLVPTLTLASDKLELPLVSGVELVAATGGRLPLWLADQAQVLASFRALTPEELEEIARRLVVPRASELDLSDELLSSLGVIAARSGRGGHELAACVRRIPAGSWTLKAPSSVGAVPRPTEPNKARRRKKKGEDG